MKNRLAIFFLFTFFVIACQKEADYFSDENIIDYAEKACSALVESGQKNKVVSSIISLENCYLFNFSNGSESMKIARGIINKIDQDRAAWKVTIHFINGLSCQMNLMGDHLGIQEDSVKLNPFGNTPLAALASFSTPFPGQVRLVIPGKGSTGITIEHTFVRDSTYYEIPILGLYSGYGTPVEFHFLDVAGNELSVDTIVIDTDPVNCSPEIVVLENNLPADESMVYMEVGFKCAFDQRGDLRWLLEDNNVGRIYDRLPNGNWIANELIGSVFYHWSSFVEIDMLGRKLKSYSVPNLGHHEIRVIGDGEYFLVNTNSVKMVEGGLTDTGTPQEDMVVEISAESGEIVNTYDFNAILDINRQPIISASDDRFHLNSSDIDIGPDGILGTSDDGVIVSSRHQCAVTKINRNTGTLNWILAPTEEWPTELQEFLLTPIDENGDILDISDINFWTYGQHSAIVLPNRNILIFDNGNHRGFYKGSELPENRYSRAVEYEIDEENRTIKKVWEFDYDRSIFNLAVGEVDYLPKSNGRLVSFMNYNTLELITPRVVEFDEQGAIIFEYSYAPNWDHYRSDKFYLYEGMN